MAQWTAKYIDDLPDSSFAYIEPGGKKDADGKTTPRAKRHFPIRDANGKLDPDHVRDAASRAPQSPFGKQALPKIRAAEKELKIGSPTTAAALCAVLKPGEPPKSIMLIPAGKFEFRDARRPGLNDEPEAAIDATDQLQMTAGLPIDYDHATDLAAPKGLPAPAAGWIKKLRVQDGEIWGDVDWTDAGAKAVASGEWKYISPVFDLDKKTRRVVRILRAALTNNPALYDTAIAARESDEGEDSMEHDEFKKKMASLFGMPEDASHDDIHAAAKKHVEVAKKKEAADAQDGDGDGDGDGDDEKAAARLIATGKVVAQGEYTRLVTEVNQIKADRARDRATVKVESAIRAGKLIPGQREWATAYCVRDEKDFDTFVAAQPTINLGSSQLRGIPAGDGASGSPTVADTIVCSSLMNVTPADLAAQRGRPLTLVYKSKFSQAETKLSK